MSAATEARLRAGLSLEVAAKKARVSSAYLRTIERRGGASYVLVMRLSRLYRCSANVFLYKGDGPIKEANSFCEVENRVRQ